MNRVLAVLRRGFAENVRFAFNAMRDHKLRSGLTILGIVVGVATVITMVSIVTGFNNGIVQNLQAFGAKTVTFQKYEDRFGPGGPRSDEERRRPNLTIGDAAAIRALVPEAEAVSVEAGYFEGDVQVRANGQVANSPYLLGTDQYYLTAEAQSMAQGRFFTPAEIDHSALVTVLGPDVRDALFAHEDPIGKEITISGLKYRVVGILEKKGEMFGFSPDNKAVLPYGAFDRQFGFEIRRHGVNINIVPRRIEDFDRMVEDASAVLRIRRKVPFDKPNNFAISTPDELISQFKSITGGVTGAMVFIALISLLIGGVGVMNIMLVSVTQRTREIGVRKAVGALRRDIIGQFLTEAVTLSTVGGLLGVAVGMGLAGLIRALPISLPATVPLWSILVGLFVSMSVGIFFGAYPAVKAARLDPIESLRYE